MANQYTWAPPTSEAELRRMYHDLGMSQQEIATALGTTQKVIYTAMRRYAISTRRAVRRTQDRENNPYWRGGRVRYGNYWYVLDPKHPHATASGYVAEHIKVALAAAGRRKLRKGEHVHHIDLNTENNEASNLAIGTLKQHGEWHASLQREAARLIALGQMDFDPVNGYCLRRRR